MVKNIFFSFEFHKSEKKEIFVFKHPSVLCKFQAKALKIIK